MLRESAVVAPVSPGAVGLGVEVRFILLISINFNPFLNCLSGCRFETKTNQRDEFSLCLPSNSYSLELQTSTLPEKYVCEHPVENIDLFNGRGKEVTFTLLVEKRKVEIKKFKSSADE